jgi:hypothetical protein
METLIDNKQEIKKDTEFVRSLIFTNRQGKQIELAAQPYTTGMYVAIQIGGDVNQLNIAHGRFVAFIDKIKKETGVKILSEGKSTYGAYLTESELISINL